MVRPSAEGVGTALREENPKAQFLFCVVRQLDSKAGERG